MENIEKIHKNLRKKEPKGISDKVTKIIIIVILFPAALISLIPLWTVFVTSFTSDKSIADYGFELWPRLFSLDGYIYIFTRPMLILSAYAVTIEVTLLGTFFGVLIMAMFAYTLTRKNFKPRKFLDFFIFFPLLFGSGTVPYYILITRYLHLKNNLLVLILPLLVSPFYVLLLRTYFKGLPPSLIEAAKLDGAGDIRIFFSIILPLSLPALSTVALFSMLGYWNDMYQALLFIDNQSLYPLQYLLYKLINDKSVIPQGSAFMGQVTPYESTRMAMAVLAILPILFSFGFVQKYFIKGITLGGVKGD